jgi:hypothetical protein
LLYRTASGEVPVAAHYTVAAGEAESAAPGFLDFELSEAQTRNFRVDQEKFLDFAPANSKSLNHDPMDCCSLRVFRVYAQ